MSSKNTNHSDSLEATKGAGITLTGTVIGKALLFGYTLFLARTVGAEIVGLYFIGYTVAHTLSLFSTFGFDVGVVRYISIYNGRDDANSMKGIVLNAVFLGITGSIIVSILIFVFSNMIAVNLFNKPELSVALKLFSLIIPCQVLMKIFLSVLRGLKNLKDSIFIENIIWIGSRFFFGFIFIKFFSKDISSLIIAYLASSLLAVFVSYYFANKMVPISNRQIKPAFHNIELIKFSIPMVFTSLIYDLMLHIDIFMLGIFVSSNEVGIYSIAIRTIALAQVFFLSFQPIFQPFVAELYDKLELKRLQQLLKSVTKWSFSLSFPIFIFLFVFSEYFLTFFGNEFLSGSICIKILVVAFTFNSLTSLTATLIYMSGKSYLSLLNNLITLFVNIALNYYMISRFGFIGAAYATGISFIILALLRLVEVYKIMEMHPFTVEYWKPISSGIIIILIILLFFNLPFTDNSFISFVKLLLLLTIYFLFLFLLKLNKEDRFIIDKMRYKIIKICKF